MTRMLDDDGLRDLLDAGVAVAAMREALLAAHDGELTAPARVRADVLTFTAGRWYGYRSYDTLRRQ